MEVDLFPNQTNPVIYGIWTCALPDMCPLHLGHSPTQGRRGAHPVRDPCVLGRDHR